jgi:hypothetical protein
MASGPHLVKVVHLGGLEQIANGHIDPLARRRLAYSPQKVFYQPLLPLLLAQMCHGISPGHLRRRTPPRLRDPPCSEKQAGIGPISQKPELVTIGLYYDDALDRTSFRQGAASSQYFFGYLHMVVSGHALPSSVLFF